MIIEIPLAKLASVKNGATGFIFEIDVEQFLTGFIIKHEDKFFAYQNKCPHTGALLDWQQGEFFDEEGKYLICATHGAFFEPDTGQCIVGPCINQKITSIPLQVKGNSVILNVGHLC